MGLNSSAFRFAALSLLQLLLSSSLPGSSGGYGLAVVMDGASDGEAMGEDSLEPPLLPMVYPPGNLGGGQHAYSYGQEPDMWPQQQPWDSTMMAVRTQGTEASATTASSPSPSPRFSGPGTPNSATQNSSSAHKPTKKLVLDKAILPLGDGPGRNRTSLPEIRVACERARPMSRLNRRMRGSCDNLHSYIIAPKGASITESEALMVRQLLYKNLMKEFKVGGVPLYWLAYLDPEISREIANMPQVLLVLPMESQKVMPENLAAPWSRGKEDFEHNRERYLPKGFGGGKGRDKDSKVKGKDDKKKGQKGRKGGLYSKGGKDKRDITPTDAAADNTRTNTDGTRLQKRVPDPPQVGLEYLQILSRRRGQFPYPPEQQVGPYLYHAPAGDQVTLYLCGTGINPQHPFSTNPLLGAPRWLELAPWGVGGNWQSSRDDPMGHGTRSYAMAASWDIGVVKKTEVVIVKWSFVDEGQGRLHPFWPWSELGTILADVDLRRLQGRAVISIPWAGSVDTFSESLPSNTNNEQLYMAHLAYEMLWVSLIERASNLGVTVVAPATSDFSIRDEPGPAGGSPVEEEMSTFPARVLRDHPTLDLIVVGSVNSSGIRSDFSRYAPNGQVTTSAVGELPCIKGDVTGHVDWDYCEGTSYAAAQVAGLAAYFISLGVITDMEHEFQSYQIPRVVKGAIQRTGYPRRWPGSDVEADFDPIAYPQWPKVAYNDYWDSDEDSDCSGSEPGGYDSGSEPGGYDSDSGYDGSSGVSDAESDDDDGVDDDGDDETLVNHPAPAAPGGSGAWGGSGYSLPSSHWGESTAAGTISPGPGPDGLFLLDDEGELEADPSSWYGPPSPVSPYSGGVPGPSSWGSPPDWLVRRQEDRGNGGEESAGVGAKKGANEKAMKQGKVSGNAKKVAPGMDEGQLIKWTIKTKSGRRKVCQRRLKPLEVTKTTCAKRGPDKLAASYRSAEHRITFFCDSKAPFVIRQSTPMHNIQQASTLGGPGKANRDDPDAFHFAARLSNEPVCQGGQMNVTRKLCMETLRAAIDSCGSKSVTYGGYATMGCFEWAAVLRNNTENLPPPLVIPHSSPRSRPAPPPRPVTVTHTRTLRPTPKPKPSSILKPTSTPINKPTLRPPPPPPSPSPSPPPHRPPAPPKPQFDCNIYAEAGKNINEDPGAGATDNDKLATSVQFRVLWTQLGKEPCRALESAITDASEGRSIVDNVRCFPGAMIATSVSTDKILRADIVAKGIEKAYPESERPRCTWREKHMALSDRDPTDSTPGNTEQGEEWKKKCKKYNVMIWWMAYFKPKCKYVPKEKKPTR